MKKLLILLLVVGCSSEDEPTPVKLVPEILYERHIETFYSEASARGLNLPVIEPEIRFTNNEEFENDCTSMGGGPVTSISYMSGDKYIIEITDKFSAKENDIDFEPLIIRELAHLLLDKDYEPHPWIQVGDTSAVNPLCSCASRDFDWNGQRTAVFDYLFQ